MSAIIHQFQTSTSNSSAPSLQLHSSQSPTSSQLSQSSSATSQPSQSPLSSQSSQPSQSSDASPAAISSPELFPFMLISEGAKEKNKSKIDLALQTVCLNVQKGDHTPAKQLAQVGGKVEQEALEFLLTTFPHERLCLLAEMAEGFALGGHDDKAWKILTLAAHPGEKFSIMERLISGFAQNNNVDEVIRVSALTTSNLNQYAMLCDSMVSGYILSGNWELAKAVIHTTPPWHLSEVLTFLGMAIAKSGRMLTDASIEEIVGTIIVTFELKLKTEDEIYIVQGLISGYANGGHFKKMNEALDVIAKNNFYRLNNWRSAMMIALGVSGNISEAYKVLDSYPDLTSAEEKCEMLVGMVMGFCAGGYTEEASKILNDARVLPSERFNMMAAMAQGFMLTGHIEATDSLLKLVSKSDEQLQLLSAIAKAHSSYMNFTSANIKLVCVAKKDRNSQNLILAHIADMIVEHGFHLNHETILQIFAIFNPHFYDELAQALIKSIGLKKEQESKELKESKESKESKEYMESKESKDKTEIDLLALLPKATKLNQVITSPPIASGCPLYARLRFGLAWMQPEIQEWLLMTGPQLEKQKNLNKDMLHSIATFLTPTPLLGTEMDAFSEMMFKRYRAKEYYTRQIKNEMTSTPNTTECKRIKECKS